MGTQKDTKFLETLGSSRIVTDEVFLIQMQQHCYLSGGDHFPVHISTGKLSKSNLFRPKRCLSSEKEKTQMNAESGERFAEKQCGRRQSKAVSGSDTNETDRNRKE
ncbi:hypothetical protein glysoja_035496 [Glycine soja]|uniref:Uncharacterized protein n=1 Tax=Glycine soja TaxID=3848 RepID=A0A0B2R2E2_GLYSO|nr:hypothetical protein glysoja_035496 [Glycine soja]